MPELVPITIARLLSLVAWISDHPGVSLDDLAAHFSRTKKQIKRDIEAIGSVGDSLPGNSFEVDWDLYETESRLVVHSTMGVSLPPRLTSREAAAILVGLDALAPSLDDDLRARIPRTALAVRALVGVDAPAPALVHADAEEEAPGTLDLLAEAIGADRPVAFTYTKADGRASRRLVDPWELRRDATGWILRGWCRTAEDERNFALGRITDAEIAPGRRSKAPEDREGRWPVVEIEVDPGGRWVGDEFESVETTPTPAGARLSIPVWNEEWLDTLLVDLAPCLVSAPEDALARAGARARRALGAWDDALNEEEA